MCISVDGPWWEVTAEQDYVCGLAIVTFCPENVKVVYAYTLVTKERPFTLEVSEELQDRFERKLGKVVVRGV